MMPPSQSSQAPPTPVVPDSVMAQYLDAAKLALEAAWGVADVAMPLNHPMLGHVPNPKSPAMEGIVALDQCLKAAWCGDGADAVIGFTMVAKSLSAKALGMRAQGMMGVSISKLGLPGS